MWRPEDQALLERLEDELVLERLFAHHAGRAAPTSRLSPRAAGLVASARRAGAADAVATAGAGDPVPLVRWLDTPPLAGRPPELLHHLALYSATVARTLADIAPEAAANAWSRALASWLALAEERAYLTRLEDAVLGPPTKAVDASLRIAPEDVPVELVSELGRVAEGAARELSHRGRAALLALAWVEHAVALAGVSADTARRARAAAERSRAAAIDAALALVGEALDEANVRSALAEEGPTILQRALSVWTWAGQDEAVEQWGVDRLSALGWELHRAGAWDELRRLLEPFRPLIESLAARIERDPTKIAFSSHCAQMYVFLSDVDGSAAGRRAHAERAVRLCPTHRNGRLVLASLLCDEAMTTMRGMVLFVRRDELARVEDLVARAEQLYPALRDLPEARAWLERVRHAPLTM